MNISVHPSVRASHICVDLSASIDVEITVDMISFFQQMPFTEREAYIEFDMGSGYEDFEKPEVWLSRITEETGVWHGLDRFDGFTESSQSLDFDPRLRSSRSWSEDSYEKLVAEVPWLRENDSLLDPADAAPVKRRMTLASIERAPVVLVQEFRVHSQVNVDIVGWLDQLPETQRADILSLPNDDDYCADAYFRRPLDYLTDYFSESLHVDVSVDSSPFVHTWVDEHDVEAAVQYRNGATTSGNNRWWNEDDFEVLSAAMPWLRDIYAATLAADDIDSDHPDYALLVDYQHRLERLPGPSDIPLFDVA